MGMTDLAAGFITAAAIKAPCRVATPGLNIALSGLAVLDAVTLADGMRVLVKDQTAKHENGIWIARAGNWERARDFDSTKEVMRGTRTLVTDGYAGANTEWFVSSLDPVPVGTGPVTFAQVTTTGAVVPKARKIEAGEGLSGGGDLSQNRTIALDFGELASLSEVDPEADYVAVRDASDGGRHKKVTVAGLVGAAAVPAARQIVAGTGLSGGGDLGTDVTLALDFAEAASKPNVTMASDQMVLHDPLAPGPARTSVATFVADLAKRRAAGTDAVSAAAAGARLDALVIEEAVTLAGAYVETAGVIPAGATSFNVGTAADADAYAAALPTGGGSTNPGAVGANFTGGVVRVAAIYLRPVAPAS